MKDRQPTTDNRRRKRSHGSRLLGGWLLVVSCWLPLEAAAQNAIEIFRNADKDLNFSTFAERIADIANIIIPFLIGLALVAVIFGVFKYVMHAGDSEKVAEGRKVFLFGIVALFMMLSFWGFVMIITNTLLGA